MVAAKGFLPALSTDPPGQEGPGGSDLSWRRVLDAVPAAG